jgi:hypothetical protein
MTDIMVTVPKGLWVDWIREGDEPGTQWQGDEYHFWIPATHLPDCRPGDRVYIVAHGKLRGFSDLVRIERHCTLATGRACLVRQGGARAVTIDRPIVGFRGWRYVDWSREEERPFPEWRQP